MLTKRQYQLFIILSIFLCVMVLVTEVYDRWQETFGLYKEVNDRERTLLEPEDLHAKKAQLVLKKQSLTGQFSKAAQTYEQNQFGLLKFLTSSAKISRIKLNSLAPGELRKDGQLNELKFVIDFRATYHQTGSFISSLESGPMSVQVVKLDLLAQRSGSSILQGHLEGNVLLPNLGE